MNTLNYDFIQTLDQLLSGAHGHPGAAAAGPAMVAPGEELEFVMEGPLVMVATFRQNGATLTPALVSLHFLSTQTLCIGGHYILHVPSTS